MHTWAWADMCCPKEEGGMGIRKLKDVNLAAGIRLVWRLCTSDSLWAQWMKAHHLQYKHINKTSSNVLDSGSRKWICNLKSYAFTHAKDAREWKRFFSVI